MTGFSMEPLRKHKVIDLLRGRIQLDARLAGFADIVVAANDGGEDGGTDEGCEKFHGNSKKSARGKPDGSGLNTGPAANWVDAHSTVRGGIF